MNCRISTNEKKMLHSITKARKTLSGWDDDSQIDILIYALKLARKELETLKWRELAELVEKREREYGDFISGKEKQILVAAL